MHRRREDEILPVNYWDSHEKILMFGKYVTQNEKKGEAEVVYLKLPFVVARIQSRYKME